LTLGMIFARNRRFSRRDRQSAPKAPKIAGKGTSGGVRRYRN
jgi:hypothetical protein